MCIVIITTAHPDYALIILDNRDEFISRPTSRPHWWQSHHQDVLSARDLQREEQGTWLGITKSGNFAVLTNYRETDTEEHPIQGTRSRGEMVTAWLTAPEDESTEEFVHRLLAGERVKGVGGFSLVCGKLRRHRDNSNEIEPLAIMSNRSGSPDDVPWIAERRGEVYGLSNTSFLDPETWPKVRMGKEKLLEVVHEAVENDSSEEELVAKLYAILDSNTLPAQAGRNFDDYIYELRKSIFIPSIGNPTEPEAPAKADAIASANPEVIGDIELRTEEIPKAGNIMTGVYGTQRQTIILVDWEGNVIFRERALWDAEAHPIPRGKGDMKFNFRIDGWNGESKGNEVHPRSEL